MSHPTDKFELRSSEDGRNSRWEKWIDANANPPGSGTTAAFVVWDSDVGNPFAGRVQPVPLNSAGAFSFVDLGGNIQFEEESATPAVYADSVELSEQVRNARAKTYTIRLRMAGAADEDVPRYETAIEGAVRAADATIKGKTITTVLNDYSFPNSCTTGRENSLPSPGGVGKAMRDLRKKVNSFYRRGGVYMVSDEMESVLLDSELSSKDFFWDSSGSVYRLFGNPLIVNQHMAAGDTDGQSVAWFGRMRLAVALGTKGNVYIGVYTQTNLGAMTVYARTRFAAAIGNEQALSVMKVGA